MIFVTSDVHLSHSNMIIRKMNNFLTDKLNVTDNDFKNLEKKNVFMINVF